MTTILLPIKPKFVEAIFAGTKLFEFRKQIPAKKVNKILIYSSSPVCAVVGEAEVSEILSDTPTNIWDVTKSYSGIDSVFFFEYFRGKSIAYAYKLKNIKRYKNSKKITDYGFKRAPQSFSYIK